MTIWTYQSQSELPYFSVAWYDGSGSLIDFSSGYTFEVKLISKKTGNVALTKNTLISGNNSDPNVVVMWQHGELNLSPDLYNLRLKATNIAGDRFFSPENEPIIRIVS